MKDSAQPRTEKLHKFIARSGICSRRQAEKLIEEGRVKVNGKIAVIGQRIDPAKDVVEVDGKVIKPVDEKIYIAFNKPKGVVTTTKDELGRTCVVDFLKKHIELSKYRLFYVGRLDKNSTGLILLTNDGELAASLLNPKKMVPKEYIVTVKGHPSKSKLAMLEQGIYLEGKKTLPCKIEVLKKNKSSTRLRIILYEGKKRQIRKMMKLINHPVVSLNRVAIGPVRLKGLKRGSFRILSEEEVAELKKACE